MKFSTAITVMLVIGVIFFMFNMMLLEGNSKFPGSNINDSALQGYDYSNSIAGNLTTMQEKFAVIGDPDAGFFSKIAAGLTAIPYAVILLPLMIIFGTVPIATGITTKMLLGLAIPGYIIGVVIISILVWAILKLVEFFGRWQV
jgi:hypothetical protein